MARCFYCDAPLSIRRLDANPTSDHVYPQASLKSHPEIKGNPLNRVPCCHLCNSYKGRLHPLDWLVIMANPARAKKLAERLVELGESMDEVFDAMRRRKR